MDKYKNYKSFLSFVVFLSAYAYSVWGSSSEGIIYTTGLFFLFMSFAIMLRDDELKELLKALIGRGKGDS